MWTIWTSLSDVPRKAVRFNHSLTHFDICFLLYITQSHRPMACLEASRAWISNYMPQITMICNHFPISSINPLCCPQVALVEVYGWSVVNTVPADLGQHAKYSLDGTMHLYCNQKTMFLMLSHAKFQFNVKKKLYFSSFSRHGITTNLCTFHDSTAVMTCAKFCSDQLHMIWTRDK